MKYLSIILMLLSINTFAVVTKNCPQNIDVLLAAPSIEKWYAIEAYEEFFNVENMIGAELKLYSTYASECNYRPMDKDSLIRMVTLEGSLRPGAKNPATAIIRFNIPVKGQTFAPIGSGVAYVGIEGIGKAGLVTSDWGKLYYQGQDCSSGWDCIPDHIYLGSFDEVVVE